MPNRIYLSPPFTGENERRAVDAAFASGWIAPCGPAVDEFERRLSAISSRNVAAVSSGTAALDLIMEELGVRPDTTVIASSLTFIATVGPAAKRGAKTVFVDSDPRTGTISIPLLAKALDDTKGRRIVIAADIYGQCCDYDSLEKLCSEKKATLVVDAAEAVGGHWNGRAAGDAGIASVYSFNGNKLITTSGGGAVLSRDRELVDRARWRSQQSRENAVWYEHREVGYNYRMSNILAALGCAQMERLEDIIARKRAIFAFYTKLFGSAAAPFPCVNRDESTRWLSVFIFPTQEVRNKIASALDAANIESRPVWKPMHLQPVFAASPVYGGRTAEEFFNRGLCLPSGAGLSGEDLERIANAIAEAK